MVDKTPSHMPGPSIERVEMAWKSFSVVTGVAKGRRVTEETDIAALVAVGTA